MAQYGKPEYWEERYQKYVLPLSFIFNRVLETKSLLTGTNVTVVSRISLLNTFSPLLKF